LVAASSVRALAEKAHHRRVPMLNDVDERKVRVQRTEQTVHGAQMQKKRPLRGLTKAITFSLIS